MLRRRCTIGLIAAVPLVAASSASAVILQSSEARNTTEPSVSHYGPTGWQLQGTWRAFNGTPISKKFFITAGHVEGDVGTKFRVGGRAFTTVAFWDDPSSDLRIYTVDKKFDSWAPLYEGTKEVGKHAVIFGRGTQRGAEVLLNGVPKGWEWGASDFVQSWGINQVDTILTGEADEGQLLQFDFDKVGAVNGEGGITAGDSGGGVFIYNKPLAQWELAGINTSVDGPFSRTSGGPTFQASLYDMGGFWYNGQFINDTIGDTPSRFFASRISSNRGWIDAVLSGKLAPSGSSEATASGVPEPSSAVLVVAAGAVAFLRRR